ncbi:MAG TPA: OmpH family outer membrane protein [Bacteroidia bacterium]|nr:OmpH family outer membrane protein [Bacteroidia bacterium]
MKNFSVILNFVLFVAVGVLYYLHFSDHAKGDALPGTSETAGIAKDLPAAPGGIVFVNSDSLLDNYAYFKSKKVELENKQERIKNELTSESDKLQRDAADYQEKAPGMTDLQRQQTEEQLMARQQKLMEKKDLLLGQLEEEKSKSSEELYTRVAGFIRSMNVEHKYNFVLGYSKGGGILFANDSLDITGKVLEGLNREFEASQKK